MSVVRWTFEDPVTSDIAEFYVNPKEGGSPSYAKNIVFKNTAGPDGRVIVFEGRPEVKELSFNGVILTEEEYDFFVEWFNKKNQFYVTDDLGRIFSIYIIGLDLRRIRAAMHPWKHEYTVRYFEVDWEL